MKKIVSIMFILSLSLILVACGNSSSEGTIKAYTRDITSGTRGAFFDIIGLEQFSGSNDGLVDGYLQVESNGAMMSSIKNDVNGIGYISLSGLEGSDLKGLSLDGVAATDHNVLNNTYELKRPFMFIRKAEENITNEEEKAFVNAFLAYMESKDGKDVIINAGGIVEGYETASLWNDIKAAHPIVTSIGPDIEIHFGGSNSVQAVARAITEPFSTIAARFRPVHNHTGSGAAFQGTRSDGNLHIGFSSRELKPEEKIIGEYGQLAWDAVVIVVNKVNELENITLTNIQDIFTGEVKFWKDIRS